MGKVAGDFVVVQDGQPVFSSADKSSCDALAMTLRGSALASGRDSKIQVGQNFGDDADKHFSEIKF